MHFLLTGWSIRCWVCAGDRTSIGLHCKKICFWNNKCVCYENKTALFCSQCLVEIFVAVYRWSQFCWAISLQFWTTCLYERYVVQSYRLGPGQQNTMQVISLLGNWQPNESGKFCNYTNWKTISKVADVELFVKTDRAKCWNWRQPKASRKAPAMHCSVWFNLTGWNKYLLQETVSVNGGLMFNAFFISVWNALSLNNF